jgi:hypothetical protein
MCSAAGMIFALSSAPIQGFLLGAGLMCYNRLFKNFSLRWVVLIGIFVITLAGVWISGHSIVHFVVANLIYDPESGYYRAWTWTKVIDAVSESPLFGLGFGPFPEYLDINHSVDALWLVLALNFGWSGATLVYLSLIAGAALPISSANLQLSQVEQKLGVALGIVITVMLMTSITVHFWGSSWVACALLLGVKAHLTELGRNGRRQRLRANVLA